MSLWGARASRCAGQGRKECLQSFSARESARCLGSHRPCMCFPRRQLSPEQGNLMHRKQSPLDLPYALASRVMVRVPPPGICRVCRNDPLANDPSLGRQTHKKLDKNPYSHTYQLEKSYFTHLVSWASHQPVPLTCTSFTACTGNPPEITLPLPALWGGVCCS